MATHLTPSDDELLRLMMAGDEAAFTALYRRRQAGVYRFALQMSGSEAIAEDVTQEVFLALMSDATRFDSSRGSLSSYLYGIARNHVLRRLERDRPFVQIVDDGSEGGEQQQLAAWVADDNPHDELQRNEMIGRLRQAVLALPEHYREVVVLCDLHEMSYVEAANALGCAIGTVRSRLHRARALLLGKLNASIMSNQEGTNPGESFKTARCFA
ncbi:MAG TPA: RNA polymerase sigma factor [Pyrinomonadaceae bacterium]|jgi:RNA polymerase sigma-70 factor (ECF subfamily)